MSDNARNRGRMAIYAMAGFYLLFMAYKLLTGLSTSSGNEKILMIVFMIFFAVVGGGMMVMGIVTGYKLSKPASDEGTDEVDGLSGESDDEE